MCLGTAFLHNGINSWDKGSAATSHILLLITRLSDSKKLKLKFIKVNCVVFKLFFIFNKILYLT